MGYLISDLDFLNVFWCAGSYWEWHYHKWIPTLTVKLGWCRSSFYCPYLVYRGLNLVTTFVLIFIILGFNNFTFEGKM